MVAESILKLTLSNLVLETTLIAAEFPAMTVVGFAVIVSVTAAAEAVAGKKVSTIRLVKTKPMVLVNLVFTDVLPNGMVYELCIYRLKYKERLAHSCIRIRTLFVQTK